jgi:hypothetical protein
VLHSVVRMVSTGPGTEISLVTSLVTSFVSTGPGTDISFVTSVVGPGVTTVFVGPSIVCVTGKETVVVRVSTVVMYEVFQDTYVWSTVTG